MTIEGAGSPVMPVYVPLKLLPEESKAVVPIDSSKRQYSASPGMRTQASPVHWKPGWHWALSVQLVGQPAPLQKYGAQVRVPAGWHTPRPLQVRAVFSVKVLAQVAAPQFVSIGCSRQAPAPLQPPARPQVVAASAGH